MYSARDIPNIISLGRIVLVFPIVWLLLDEQFITAIILFFVAGVSDGVDGYLAKHYHWESRFGGIIDPLADKFLLVSTYVCLAVLQALPWWFVGMILLRDVVIIGAVTFYNFRIARLEAAPTLISKLNTLLQILLALMVVFDLAFDNVNATLILVMLWAVVVSTVGSFVGYAVEWNRRTGENNHSG